MSCGVKRVQSRERRLMRLRSSLVSVFKLLSVLSWTRKGQVLHGVKCAQLSSMVYGARPWKKPFCKSMCFLPWDSTIRH